MAEHPFRVAVEAGDLPAMIEALAPDVSFRSPVTFKPFEGRDAVAVVLGAVVEVFEDFGYTDELAGEGTSALVFEARVARSAAAGNRPAALRRRRPDRGLTVLVRPLSAALALRDAMGRQLGVAEGGQAQ